jgi:hypothetical protein
VRNRALGSVAIARLVGSEVDLGELDRGLLRPFGRRRRRCRGETLGAIAGLGCLVQRNLCRRRRSRADQVEPVFGALDRELRADTRAIQIEDDPDSVRRVLPQPEALDPARGDPIAPRGSVEVRRRDIEVGARGIIERLEDAARWRTGQRDRDLAVRHVNPAQIAPDSARVSPRVENVRKPGGFADRCKGNVGLLVDRLDRLEDLAAVRVLENRLAPADPADRIAAGQGSAYVSQSDPNLAVLDDEWMASLDFAAEREELDLGLLGEQRQGEKHKGAGSQCASREAPWIWRDEQLQSVPAGHRVSIVL